MVVVESYEYDLGQTGEDGNLTKLTRPVDADPSHDRVRTYGYDFRNRRTRLAGEIDFYEAYTLDNLVRVTRTDQHDTNANGTIVARLDTFFDDRGREYRTQRFGWNPQSGSPHLDTNSWFDPAGNLIKRQEAGNKAFTKNDYDGVSRVIANYLSLDANESPGESAGGVADDIVIEQSEMTYDAADNIIFAIQSARFHNASGPGPLKGPAGDEPLARVTYTATWPDALGRIWTSANYGTNGDSEPTRPALAPASTGDTLVTVTLYNERGEAWQTTDPAGKVQQIVFDDAARKITEVQNVVTSGTSFDENKTTLFTYTGSC